MSHQTMRFMARKPITTTRKERIPEWAERKSVVGPAVKDTPGEPAARDGPDCIKGSADK
jgi:hypothetical protein